LAQLLPAGGICGTQRAAQRAIAGNVAARPPWPAWKSGAWLDMASPTLVNAALRDNLQTVGVTPPIVAKLVALVNRLSY
jgi:hypothetical protein